MRESFQKLETPPRSSMESDVPSPEARKEGEEPKKESEPSQVEGVLR